MLESAVPDIDDESKKYIIMGRKTFFICPDVSLLPESYLEDYLARGYETYIISDDRICPLTKKIEMIISVFTDSILFFYIDADIEGIEWSSYIKALQTTYGSKVLIGVLYTKRSNEKEKFNLEKYYLYDVGIQCGCIALEYQRAKNFYLIDKIMFANQACGRRKTVRAFCDKSSEVVFEYKKKRIRGKLSDISINHFSCTFDVDPAIQQYEKLNRCIFLVDGMHFESDAVLMISREVNGQMLYIFLFTKKDGSNGLDEDSMNRLGQKIYQLVTTRAKALMNSMFDKARRIVSEEYEELERV
ncbi:MAG: hypothetical protein J1F14_08425 [Treponema sp.]|nr:hypothetical protein [Treponema sp.]